VKVILKRCGILRCVIFVQDGSGNKKESECNYRACDKIQ
jgi:hypothetical protein